jgi:Reverse transcriptase (RNA-dependent DNA polymerase)
MNHEVDTLQQADTWEMVLLPTNKNMARCKWVFRIKCKANGLVNKYKVHLVVCSFTQVHSVDYFSPIVKLSSFQAMLVITVMND